jgi:hypothetical protein
MTVKILKMLLTAGIIAVALTSPYAGPKIIYGMFGKLIGGSWEDDEENRKKARSVFYYLKNKGLIDVRVRNGQLFVSLTDEGKRVAGKYQINDLKIRKPKKWDKKWRILIFDIVDKHKIKREALRGKLKELGFYQLQKSVWVYPYDFEREAVLLREFLGLEIKEVTIITESKIEGDAGLKTFFDIT